MSDRGKRQVDIAIQVGDYTLSIQDADSFFLQNERGEGTRLWNNDLAEIFEEYFKENF